MLSDTVAKLVYAWSRPDRLPDPWWQYGPGTTVIVDAASMFATHDLHRMMQLARQERWRLVLVGDPHQLKAVGRGGMFAELCTAGRTIELERIHRFVEPWEAAASLQLRHGDARALDAYAAHDRIAAGPLDEHVDAIATYRLDLHDRDESLAITTARNADVDLIDDRIQNLRWQRGDLDRTRRAETADGIGAYVGDLIATRRNDRTLVTSGGQFVRNRDQWIVTAIDGHGDVTAARIDGEGVVTLPADYASDHVRLGYSVTEPGDQSGNQDRGVVMATSSTTGRGLYVALTRGRRSNHVLAIAETHDLTDAREILDLASANDRADVPAITRRQQLRDDRLNTVFERWIDQGLSSAGPKGVEVL